MPTLSTLFLKQERPYTGPELRPHFLLTEMGLKGSALGAFIGPCLVKTEHLVDWEDRLAQDRIEARWMVHFIGEFFGGCTLREGVLIQRFLMALMGEEVNRCLFEKGAGVLCRREGDDLYIQVGEGERKLSVSIVTASPVSILLHVGINIDPAGAPVPAIGLAELGISTEEWVARVLARFAAEYQDVEWACAKVRPVM
jgi:hypothetical protein